MTALIPNALRIKRHLESDQRFFELLYFRLPSLEVIELLGYAIWDHRKIVNIHIMYDDAVNELLELMDGNGFIIKHYPTPEASFIAVEIVYKDEEESTATKDKSVTVTAYWDTYASCTEYYNSEEIQELREVYNYYKVPKRLSYNKKYKLKPEPEHPT